MLYGVVENNARPIDRDKRRCTASHASNLTSGCPNSSSTAALTDADSNPPSAFADRKIMRLTGNVLDPGALTLSGLEKILSLAAYSQLNIPS